MNSRSERYKLGLWAEFLASIYLRCKLYKIISSRNRNFGGEIDLIAVKNNTLVFIEVKARSMLATDREVLGYKQQQRILNAAQLFIRQNYFYQQYDLRFDLIIMQPLKWPIHLINAWGENY